MTAPVPGAASTRPHVVLGVGGGIAAYKACELLRLFTESRCEVTVIPTAAALQFVGEPTWAALSGRPVASEVWHDVHEVPHVRLGREADLVVVAPATADLMARAAQGRADDLLTSTLLTSRAPVLLAPAMHTEMWEHPATRENVATLRRHGYVVLDPAVGRLTGPDTGRGRLPDPEEIHATALDLHERRGGGSDVGRDLEGRRVVVSAGGTREPLDPVRFLGNRSSGLQGFALARTAALRGAEVTLVAANTDLPVPAGVEVREVETTEELQTQVVAASADADVVVMAAAPADFAPVSLAGAKIKKSSDGSTPSIELRETPDVLAGLVADRGDETSPVIVGFAAETGDANGSVIDHARAKLARKGCDLLVVNDVGGGAVFGRPDNSAVLLAVGASPYDVPQGSKSALAHVVWDRVVALLDPSRGAAAEPDAGGRHASESRDL
ncbi:phosphopantothenoylcysteine decarboxylase [Marmoricola endophyticus]|uniref:Coenzyme A biosynthesis bifunctional protein CoaBC n=1 Tax=Marmoricola endophyticus TaxID=2040280 RepID=A0A917BC03_9ACTN|nr:bifunctional phosphopantothenoylcysteine decarboxylase/phosphopantothenate--cysteine ligase CoaBC [Marmoricola endophyticus]GGF35789.1 phosphopantothenoylcysteine decarboxylase [Marmoricola endophyticus]